MKILSIFLSCLIVCCLACSKVKLATTLAPNCPLIANAKIIPEDQLPCDYNVVYSFKGEIYTYCVCCSCFKWAPPINCEGLPLCERRNGCWEEFQENAEYLFSIELL